MYLPTDPPEYLYISNDQFILWFGIPILIGLIIGYWMGKKSD